MSRVDCSPDRFNKSVVAPPTANATQSKFIFRTAADQKCGQGVYLRGALMSAFLSHRTTIRGLIIGVPHRTAECCRDSSEHGERRWRAAVEGRVPRFDNSSLVLTLTNIFLKHMNISFHSQPIICGNLYDNLELRMLHS